MTVKELIEKLKEMPEDATVVTWSDEADFWEITEANSRTDKLSSRDSEPRPMVLLE